MLDPETVKIQRETAGAIGQTIEALEAIRIRASAVMAGDSETDHETCRTRGNLFNLIREVCGALEQQQFRIDRFPAAPPLSGPDEISRLDAIDKNVNSILKTLSPEAAVTPSFEAPN